MKVFRFNELVEIDPYHVVMMREDSDSIIIFHDPFVGEKFREFLDNKHIPYTAGVKSIHIDKRYLDFGVNE